MMDGYSVQDAASVLGVPEGRVWELLARGVLSGTPDGDSMRVFLKADAPAPARSAARPELPAGNGNAGSHGGEGSAFRELLTEFRNLTERYGQALLALGEARGEVAGLRSRVEQLEARIDLRLPSRGQEEPISWAAPAPRAPITEAPSPEPPSPAEVEAVLPAPAPVERGPRPRKARSPRAAVAGFAEALARAQDPNLAPVAEVISSTEQAAEPVRDAEPAEAEIPAEPILTAAAEPAEAAPASAPTEPTYRPADVEPDWFADGDFSWLDAADLDARSQPRLVAAEVGAAQVVEPVEPANVADTLAIGVPAAEPAPAPLEVEPLPVGVDVAAEPSAPPEPSPSPSARMEPVEMSDAGEAALDWRGEPFEASGEMEVASPRSYSGPTLAPRIRDALEPVSWPTTDRAAATTQAVAPPLAMTEAELAQLARDEGWDEAEVAAIRAMISRPSAPIVELPGSAELDEAISALQAVPIAPRSGPAPDSQWAKPAARDDEGRIGDDWAFDVEPEPMPIRASAPRPHAAAHRGQPDPDWLRRRRGPAASAYRRIRRIFTG